MAYSRSDLENIFPLLTSGKVRDLYEVDPSTLLFVATDRISAYDVIMKNVSAYLLLLEAYAVSILFKFQVQFQRVNLIDSFTNSQSPPPNRASLPRASS
jgi:phosphoribosylaminoimidazole-succinocarboxamide synthase